MRLVKCRPGMVAAFVLLMLNTGTAFCQTGEEANFSDFNWHAMLGLDSPTVLNKLWGHAQLFKDQTYDTKAILDIELDIYARGKVLEKTFSYDSGQESRSRYQVTYDRKYSEWLDLPWAELLKLNVRSAMQYLLLEILYTKSIPKSKTEIPVHWTLYREYFNYYYVLKLASK
jgi:hypothetical protein